MHVNIFFIFKRNLDLNFMNLIFVERDNEAAIDYCRDGKDSGGICNFLCMYVRMYVSFAT